MIKQLCKNELVFKTKNKDDNLLTMSKKQHETIFVVETIEIESDAQLFRTELNLNELSFKIISQKVVK